MSPHEATGRLQHVADLAFGSLPYVTLLGCAGIAANVLLSFEEPHGGILFVSCLLMAAAPVGLTLHLVFTGELGSEDKRRWTRGLMKGSGWTLFTAYFTPSERRRATQQLKAQEGVESQTP